MGGLAFFLSIVRTARNTSIASRRKIVVCSATPKAANTKREFVLLFNQSPTILYHLLRIYPSAINNPELNK